MTEIIDNIGYRGKKQNFERDAFSTIAAMKAFNENYLPDMFEVFCYETKKKYRFLRDNPIDETLGKWREVIDFTGVYPEASTDNKGIVQIGEGLSVENGVVSADTQSDENFTSELKSKLEGIDTSLYVEKEDGKELSSNDFTDELKTKLDGIDTSLYVEKEEGKGLSANDLTDTLKAKYDEAQKNVQSDWNQDDDLKDSYIKNKPTKLSDFENDSEFVTKTTFETVTNPIVEVIPDQATASNQLADKDFVNSSISTNTAFFKGTYDSVDNLPASATINDYAFVKGTDELGNKYFARYKYNGAEWLYEYDLNNSSFTEEQWKAINSLITSDLVTEFKGKQDKITTSIDETDFTDDSIVTEVNTTNSSLSKSHKLSKFLAYIKSKLVKDSVTSTDNVWTAKKVCDEIGYVGNVEIASKWNDIIPNRDGRYKITYVEADSISNLPEDGCDFIVKSIRYKKDGAFYCDTTYYKIDSDIEYRHVMESIDGDEWGLPVFIKIKKNDKIQTIDYTDDSLHPIKDTTETVNFSDLDTDGSNPKISFRRTWLQAWNYIKGKADSVYNPSITITSDGKNISDNTTLMLNGVAGKNPTALSSRPASKIWDYIQEKISSVLGLTSSSFGGISARAYNISSGRIYIKAVEPDEGQSYATKAIEGVPALVSYLISIGKVNGGGTGYFATPVYFNYANNNRLRVNVDGIKYEMQLAGAVIEVIGYTTTDPVNNTGAQYFIRISSSAGSEHYSATSGYRVFPKNSVLEYRQAGTSTSAIIRRNYNTIWFTHTVTATEATNKYFSINTELSASGITPSTLLYINAISLTIGRNVNNVQYQKYKTDGTSSSGSVMVIFSSLTTGDIITLAVTYLV